MVANRGPPHFPCTVCHKIVRNNQHWYVLILVISGHTLAVPACISKEEYERLTADSELEWMWPTCTDDTNDQSPATAALSLRANFLPPSMHSPFESPSNLAAFCYVNAKSLMNKIDELRSILSAVSRPVIFGVSETWLNDSIPYDEAGIHTILCSVSAGQR